jgi:hypothetical protein
MYCTVCPGAAAIGVLEAGDPGTVVRLAMGAVEVTGDPKGEVVMGTIGDIGVGAVTGTSFGSFSFFSLRRRRYVITPACKTGQFLRYVHVLISFESLQLGNTTYN